MIREAYELGMQECFEKLAQTYSTDEHRANVKRHWAEVPALVTGSTAAIGGAMGAAKGHAQERHRSGDVKEMISFGKKYRKLKNMRELKGAAKQGLRTGAKAALIAAPLSLGANALQRRWSNQVLKEAK